MKVKADFSQQVISTPILLNSNMLDTSGELVNKIKVMSVSEHDLLVHREYPNQHPISSITSLESALGSRPSDAITNMDIYEILSH